MISLWHFPEQEYGLVFKIGCHDAFCKEVDTATIPQLWGVISKDLNCSTDLKNISVKYLLCVL
jgi:hypothetical protein